MKRWLWVLVLLAVTGGALVQQSSRGQQPAPKGPIHPGDLGPGAQGSTLRLPGMEPSTPAYAPNPYAAPGIIAAPPSGKPVGRPASRVALPPSNQTDLNKDITITPSVGPWTILVMSYTTPRIPDAPGLDAARMARDFVTEWNTNPAYARFKLKAHVFNYGAEEKQKEYERVQKLKQEQIAALNQLGLNGKSMPIRISTVHIDEQTAVLLGGFRDADAAMAVAKEIRKIKVGNDFARRVKVDTRHTVAYEPDAPGREGSVKDKVIEYVNPFTKASPVRNPSVKAEAQTVTPAAELDFLRKVNKGEPLSLLNSKKPWTLAVKQFNSQYKTMTDNKEAKGFIEKFSQGFGLHNKEWTDHTAHNAHNLADGMKKTGLEAYVLHCQCCSYVTVGSFASLQDPQLVQMQRFLETHFQAEAFRALDMFARPVPMPVPGMVN